MIKFLRRLFGKREITLENLEVTSEGYYFIDVRVNGVYTNIFIDPAYQKDWRSMPSGSILRDKELILKANDLILAYHAKKKGESSAYRTMFGAAIQSDSHTVIKRGDKQ